MENSATYSCDMSLGKEKCSECASGTSHTMRESDLLIPFASLINLWHPIETIFPGMDCKVFAAALCYYKIKRRVEILEITVDKS